MATGLPGVLVIEDEAAVADVLQAMLREIGYDAYAIAASADEALAEAVERRPDLALVDIRIKGPADGIATATLLKRRFDVPIVYLTAHADAATLDRAKLTRPHGFLKKPVRSADLRSAIETALRQRDSSQEPAALRLPDTRPATTAPSGRGAGAKAVRKQLAHIFGSDDFDASRRSRDFLRFVVEETLAGRAAALTQEAIATCVFQRKDGFDPTLDPIVRIQAGRLRRSLERYYLLSGREDPVRIELNRGSYAAVFRGQSPTAEPAPEDTVAREEAGEGWPAIVVGTFEMDGDSDVRESAGRVTEELALELGRHRGARVLRQGDLDQVEPAKRGYARFALHGRVERVERGLRVAARLVDRNSGEQVWADQYSTWPEEGRWSGTPEDIARVIAACVGGEEGVVVQTLAGERRRNPKPATTAYDAFLLSFEFFLGDMGSFVPAMETLLRTVEAEPELGVAWARLSRLHIANTSLQVAPVSTSLEQAVAYAQTAVRVDPTSRSARWKLALALLLRGELAAAREELDQALRVAPDSLVFLEMIGLLLTLAGDFERGPALIRSACERNPHCLPYGTFGLWFDALRRGEIEEAHRHAVRYRDGAFFWTPLMRACCLGLLGRESEARAEVAELLKQKPDFEAQGRTLIGYYVKFPEAVDRILRGLANAGLKVA